MAPLSILPGRVRFESQCLIGKPHICRYLQERSMNCVRGVMEVAVNHKTGRILVRFDERQIDRQALSQHINHIMQEGEEKATDNWWFSANEKNAKPFIAKHALHAMVDLAAHTILPKPLNTLIPMAVKFASGR